MRTGGARQGWARPAADGVFGGPLSTFGPLLDRLLPEAAERPLAKVLGSTMPRRGEGGRYRITSAGRFQGRVGADLLAFARNHAMDAALVLGDEDTIRVLYFEEGRVVGSDSTVIFERLGRTLLRWGALTPAEADAVIEMEEAAGLVVASGLLSAEALKFGLEQRTWEIGTALPFMHGAHFLFVDGKPELGGLPRLSIAAMDLALEGMRRYDEWRNRESPAAAGATPRPAASHPENGAAVPAAPVATVSAARPTGTPGPRGLPPRLGRASAADSARH